MISLDASNVEASPEMESLLGVRILLPRFRSDTNGVSRLQRKFTFTLFTSSNSHALAAPSLKELHSWMSKLDPTRPIS